MLPHVAPCGRRLLGRLSAGCKGSLGNCKGTSRQLQRLDNALQDLWSLGHKAGSVQVPAKPCDALCLAGSWRGPERIQACAGSLYLHKYPALVSSGLQMMQPLLKSTYWEACHRGNPHSSICQVSSNSCCQAGTVAIQQ